MPHIGKTYQKENRQTEAVRLSVGGLDEPSTAMLGRLFERALLPCNELVKRADNHDRNHERKRQQAAIKVQDG